MNPWTDERIATLRDLLAKGCSYSEIARALGGGITRNAAIGKAQRLGISERLKPSKPRSECSANPRPILIKPAPVLKAAPVPIAAPVVESFTLRSVAGEKARLREPCAGACRWPVGDPRDDSFGYCGAPADGNYCASHATLSRQAGSSKPRQAPSRLLTGSAPNQHRPSSTVMDRRWS